MTLASIDPTAILPAISLAAIAGAAMAATISWRSRAVRDRLTGWEVSGALAFIGIAASVFGEPDYVVRLLSQRQPQ